MKKIKVIAIVGPTALGKSELAVFLARKLNGEVVSADSRQVYQGMDIGTGKITPKDMKGIPHHMLDIASPKRRITVVKYAALARRAIGDIARRGNVPIVCGGSGFYIEELLFPSSLPNVPADKKLRAKLSKMSTEKLFAKLMKKDPRRAKTLDPKNKVRIIRALEITEALGRVPKRKKGQSPYKVLTIGLDAPIETIRSKVQRRLRKRMNAGLVAEGKKLQKKSLTFKAMESFGLEYKWLSLFIQKKIDRKEFMEGLEKDIVAYAKRQKTWFRAKKNIYWLEADNKKIRTKSLTLAKQFLDK